jgi:hypothetical protein
MKLQLNQVIDVELTREQKKQAAYDFLQDKYDWSPDYIIKNNKIFWPRTRYSSHSWIEDVYIRDATEIDLFLASIFKNV